MPSDSSTGDTEHQRFVIVGCGSAKRDRELVPGTLRVKRYPLRELYTSTYFRKKREYAETVADEWCVLSALHGLRYHGEEFEPYDVSIEDLDDDQLDDLAHRVGMMLIEWITWDTTTVEEIVVLAGKKYIDPLRKRDAFSAGIEPRVTFPFQQNELGGIGEQMAWLDERINAHEQKQAQLVTDGGYYDPPQNTRQVHDPGPDPEDACIECGKYGDLRCGCCGFPLCGRHHEVGGGFCTRFTPIEDVPLCAYSNDVYVRALPRPDGEEPWVLDDGHGVAFHLPSPGDPETPFCGGLPASRVTSRPLGDSLIDEHDLCEDCAEAARYERRARKRLVARDLQSAGGDSA